MELIDTHCHIHDEAFYPENREEVYRQSREAGVTMLCVGTEVRSSRDAVDFCVTHEGAYPIVGIHPHDAKDNDPEEIHALVDARRDQIVGIGEIGLDYFYDHSPHDIQQQVLRAQLTIASEYSLPVSFHVRDVSDETQAGQVWRDFWPIVDEFPDIRGVLHSFTDTQINLEEALKRGLKIGLNGISTFTKDEAQQELYRSLPLEHIVIETDAPFLTPKPLRGKINSPAYVGRIAEHQAEVKGISLEEVCRVTTQNARSIFGTKL